jgi:hypothetical protein
VLRFPLVLAVTAGTGTRFFLEDLGADDVGPGDVASSFLLFVQAPTQWTAAIMGAITSSVGGEGGNVDAGGVGSTGQRTQHPLSAMAAGTGPPLIDTLALGLLVITASLVTWSACHKLCEIFWTTPPDVVTMPPAHAPSDEDLVATLQTDLDDGELAPARYMAFAVLIRRLLAADRSCASLFSCRSRERSHWENIVEVCVKVRTRTLRVLSCCHHQPSHTTVTNINTSDSTATTLVLSPPPYFDHRHRHRHRHRQCIAAHSFSSSTR